MLIVFYKNINYAAKILVKNLIQILGRIGQIQPTEFSVLYQPTYKLVALGYVIIPCIVFLFYSLDFFNS